MKTEVTGSGVDLSKVTFGAKIDYLTIQTPGKQRLPYLFCKAIWPRKYHGQRLTLHDPQPLDVRSVMASLGPARLLEVEIAIDLRPRPIVPAEEREELLKIAMVELFAARLDPSSGKSMKNEFRAFYRRLDEGYKVSPFNKVLPRATDQQLHGLRHDHAQVKGYLKRRDQRAVLDVERHAARIEVRLSGEGLEAHGLRTMADLMGFRFRKGLMPYFTHMRGTKRRASRQPGGPTDMGRILAQKSAEIDQEVWNQVGVGGFRPGGRRQDTNVILLADMAVNDRLGQSLTRLEQRFRSKKFVFSPEVFEPRE